MIKPINNKIVNSNPDNQQQMSVRDRIVAVGGSVLAVFALARLLSGRSR